MDIPSFGSAPNATDHSIADTFASQDYSALLAQICDGTSAIFGFLDFKTKNLKFLSSTSITETMHKACQKSLETNEIYIHPLPEEISDNNTGTFIASPLHGPGGTPLGTICIQGVKNSFLTENQKNSLLRLGRQLVQYLELKKTHRLLREELSAMTSTLEHEINNPLTIIVGKTTQIKSVIFDHEHTKKEKLLYDLESILTHSERIKKFIATLREKTNPPIKPLLEIRAMNQILNEVISMSQQALDAANLELNIDLKINAKILCAPDTLMKALFAMIEHFIFAHLDQKKEGTIQLRVLKHEYTAEIQIEANIIAPPIQKEGELKEAIEGMGGSFKFETLPEGVRVAIHLPTLIG